MSFTQLWAGFWLALWVARVEWLLFSHPSPKEKVEGNLTWGSTPLLFPFPALIPPPPSSYLTGPHHNATTPFLFWFAFLFLSFFIKLGMRHYLPHYSMPFAHLGFCAFPMANNFQGFVLLGLFIPN